MQTRIATALALTTALAGASPALAQSEGGDGIDPCEGGACRADADRDGTVTAP